MNSENLLPGTGKPKRSSYLAIALILLSPMALMDISYAAGRVFSDNFEDGTTNKWIQDDFRTKATATQIAVDGLGPHSGGYFAKINFNGLVAWNDPLAYTTLRLNSWSYNKEFLIRMWWRLDKDFGGGMGAPGDGAKLMRLNDVPPSGSYGVFMLQGGGSHEQWNYDTTLFINNWSGDKGTLLSQRGVWHKIEIYVYQDNTNGVIKRWQDGALTYSYTGKTNDSSNSRYYPLYLPSNWSNNPGWEHGANNHFYIDDVEIYSDAGTGATGSMSDATISTGGSSVTSPPMAPTSLRVQ
jgi:hypothetical protein